MDDLDRQVARIESSADSLKKQRDRAKSDLDEKTADIDKLKEQESDLTSKRLEKVESRTALQQRREELERLLPGERDSEIPESPPLGPGKRDRSFRG